MRTRLIYSICLIGGLFNGAIAYGLNIEANPDSAIEVSVSKTGLNRISNPPYKIVQVTGDDSQFKIKHDEDGQNIYFMPLTEVGSKIEISIRNDASQTQDLVLKVAPIKGQSINIKSFKSQSITKFEEETSVSRMLKAMKQGRKDKFFVQNIKRGNLKKMDGFKVRQIKNYKWKNLNGGVFKITNGSRKSKIFDLETFTKRFENILAFYPENGVISGKEEKLFFVIQKSEEK